jgi:hypothetical protein
VTTALATTNGPELGAIEALIVAGDLSKLNPAQRVTYYRARCEAAGLDYRCQPFQYLSLQGKLVLYATKACTDQLAGLHKLSVAVTAPQIDREAGICVVTCRVTWPDGRHVEDMGAVPILGLKGEALCNALLKATTKAKRRSILSACGLGMLDESEVEAIPEARPFPGPHGGPPASDAPKATAPPPAAPRGDDGPQDGRGLFKRIADHEKAHGKGLLAHVNAWGKAQRLPFKMIEWPGDAVADAWQVVLDYLGEPAEDAPDADPDFDETAHGDAYEGN